MALVRMWVLVLVLACSASVIYAGEWTIHNPAKRAYIDEPIRLPLAVPQGAFQVLEDGKEVPYQIESAEGNQTIWVLTSMPKDGSHTYTTAPGAPSKVTPRVRVSGVDNLLMMVSDSIGISVPANDANGGGNLPPIQQLRLGETWIGSGLWHLNKDRTLKSFKSEILADGTLYGKVRLLYEYEGTGGALGETPAFVEVIFTLLPGRPYVLVEERHAMSRGEYWEFDCAAGWDGRKAMCQIFGGGAGKAENPSKWPTDLTPIGNSAEAIAKRYATQDPRIGNTLLWLVPRWNQHYEDGWYFAVHNESDAVGALVCDAGSWVWPHNNKIEVIAKPSADYAGLRCPVWKGARKWMLVAGPVAEVGAGPAKSLVKNARWTALDKLQHDFLLTWDDRKGYFNAQDFYTSGINPTGFWRNMARQAIRAAQSRSTAPRPAVKVAPVDDKAEKNKNKKKKKKKKRSAKESSIEDLTRVQVMLHPDMYGTYWNYWSPENPNFFTDFIKLPLAEASKLHGHPRFKEIANLCELKVREDLYHSVTLPGGAGQECPGYLNHAMHQWEEIAPICKKHFGFDPTTWPRYKAAHSFLRHISQPRPGGQRVFHPGGDTHPGKNGPNPIEVKEDVRKWTTEELPGFGVIFRNRPGTDRETYLAFKSGPNRGHYHGDQLSLHLCFDATPRAVDHFCSYNPRAGQEHMHNRVSFSTKSMPYANMDGYERVIAFTTSPVADIAVGQVESERLRPVAPLPPEEWDVDQPQVRFEKPLRYRRTVVLLKGEQDAIVLRDQHDGADLTATYNLHVPGIKADRKGDTIHFNGLDLICVTPNEFKYETLPFTHENGGGQTTIGVRLSTTGPTSEFITVLLPTGAKIAVDKIAGGVKVGDTAVTFAGKIDEAKDTAYVTITPASGTPVRLTGEALDLNRSQGEVGLFVPDAGYPFGEIPEWLIRQRAKKPDWAPKSWPPFEKKQETNAH